VIEKMPASLARPALRLSTQAETRHTCQQRPSHRGNERTL